MIELDDLQRDALSEMFNIGVGRAASSLSLIVHDEVELTAPGIMFMNPSEVSAQVTGGDSHQLSMVSQNYSGPFDAKAMLLFPEENALTIVGLMIGSNMSPEELSDFAQEAMCEVGNIILNACISAMADLFEVEFEGSLPEHQLGDGDALDLGGDGGSHVVLVLQVALNVRKSEIKGNLLFLMSVSSLNELLSCLNRYLVKQGLA